MKIVAAADIHGSSVALLKVSGRAREVNADVILLAGDITAHHLFNGFCDLLHKAVKHAKCPIILTLGNHDTLDPEKYFPDSAAIISGTKPMTKKSVVCLLEQAVTYQGVKFWGSPYTVDSSAETGRRWNYQLPVDQLRFDIPADTDVLITHSPPMLDDIHKNNVALGNIKEHEQIGSEMLTQAVWNCPSVKLHVFGHYHDDGGHGYCVGGTRFCNVSCHRDDWQFNPDGIMILEI